MIHYWGNNEYNILIIPNFKLTTWLFNQLSSPFAGNVPHWSVSHMFPLNIIGLNHWWWKTRLHCFLITLLFWCCCLFSAYNQGSTWNTTGKSAKKLHCKRWLYLTTIAENTPLHPYRWIPAPVWLSHQTKTTIYYTAVPLFSTALHCNMHNYLSWIHEGCGATALCRPRHLWWHTLKQFVSQ